MRLGQAGGDGEPLDELDHGVIVEAALADVGLLGESHLQLTALLGRLDVDAGLAEAPGGHPGPRRLEAG